jgi:hypothetical protein
MATLLQAMRTRLPQVEKTGLAIATHFAACAFLCALAVFGFYRLMQPERNANLGIAAYTAAAHRNNFPVAAQFTRNQRATFSPASDVSPANNADETTGRAIQAEEAAAPQTVDPPPAIVGTPAPAEKRTAKKGISTRETGSARNYHSSPRVGPYPGYAAVH